MRNSIPICTTGHSASGRQVRERGYLALASEESQETLQQALAVVDAKSLYDIVSKDTHGLALQP